MSAKQGKTVFVRNKLRMLKRTQTMHTEYTCPVEQNIDVCLQRHESWQSLEIDPISIGAENADKQIDKQNAIDHTMNITQIGEHDNEQLELLSRRGRRSAIIDNKNLIGDSEVEYQEVSTTAQNNNTSTEITQERTIGPTVNLFRERQRRMLRKQHTIADLSYRNQTNSTTTTANTNLTHEFESKRRANVFFKLIDRGTRSKESLLDLCDALQALKPSSFHDSYLESYKDFHWSQLPSSNEKGDSSSDQMPDREVRRREAVWELFKSELTFFTDHLMVLKNCFMEPLKKLQVDGYLMFVEPMHLFGNLDDICYVSHTFCRELISSFTQESAIGDFGNTNVLLRPLKRWSEHSRNGEVYHNYCLNYDFALAYLDGLRKYEQFNEFEKWSEQDPRCRRLQLTDLLVAPMQHYMKIPLMLNSIRRYTAANEEQEMLSACLSKVENSLKSLEDKMRWLKNFERLQEIQAQLVWPPVSELEPRVFIPEFLRQSLSKQPCERLVANPKRQLLHEGFLTLNDGSKTIEIFAFLFDDFLLITKIKKPPKKKSFSENPLIGRSMTEGGVFVVYRQVIALDRFTIHDLGIVEATANGLRYAIVLVLITRFQQITGVYTLQASNELDKQRWIEKLRNSQQAFQEKLKRKLYGIDIDHFTNKHSKLLSQKLKSLGLTDLHCSTCLTKTIENLENTNRNANVTDPIPSTTNITGGSSSSSSGNNNKFSSDNLFKPISKQNSLDKNNVNISLSNSTEKPLSSSNEAKKNTYNSLTKQTLVSSIDTENINRTTSNITTITTETETETSDEFNSSGFHLRNRHSLDPTISKLPNCDSKSTSPDLLNPNNNNNNMLSIPEQNIPATLLIDKHFPQLPILSNNVQCNRVSDVQFPYEITRQTPFSPPLSPVLHAPCASLPLDITVNDPFDLPDRYFAPQISKRTSKGQSTSPPTDRKK